MNIYLILILVIIVCLMFTKTYKQTKALNKDSNYINAYIDILKGKEGSYDALQEYMKNETNPELINKCKVVKVYCDIDENKDVVDLAKEIDFGTIFKDEEKVSIDKIVTNSDCFVWLLLDLAKANSNNNKEAIKILKESVDTYKEDINNVVEYRVFDCAYNIIFNVDEDTSFLDKLLNGEYGEYRYDKHLIGVFKKMATAIKAFSNKELSESDVELLKEFVTTQVGSIFMKDLGIADSYKEKEEEIVE